MNWHGVNVTKLLVRVDDHKGKSKVMTANPITYINVSEALSNWLHWSFTIIATDRYTLDAEHSVRVTRSDDER